MSDSHKWIRENCPQARLSGMGRGEYLELRKRLEYLEDEICKLRLRANQSLHEDEEEIVLLELKLNILKYKQIHNQMVTIIMGFM